MDDMDRTPALIEAADPPEHDNAAPDDEGWGDLAARFDGLSGVEFIRLPRPARRAAVRSRRAS